MRQASPVQHQLDPAEVAVRARRHGIELRTPSPGIDPAEHLRDISTFIRCAGAARDQLGIDPNWHVELEMAFAMRDEPDMPQNSAVFDQVSARREYRLGANQQGIQPESVQQYLTLLQELWKIAKATPD